MEPATGPDDGFGHGMPLVQVPAPRLAEVEAYVHAGIAPATKCVCCADLDHFKGMIAMLGRQTRPMDYTLPKAPDEFRRDLSARSIARSWQRGVHAW